MDATDDRPALRSAISMIVSRQADPPGGPDDEDDDERPPTSESSGWIDPANWDWPSIAVAIARTCPQVRLDDKRELVPSRVGCLLVGAPPPPAPGAPSHGISARAFDADPAPRAWAGRN